MLLYSRTSMIVGPPNEVLPTLAAITAKVSDLSGREVSLWAGGPGFPVGTYSWATRIESHADIGDMATKLAADADFSALVATMLKYRAGDTVDSVRSLIHGQPGDGLPPVGSLVAATTAQIANGNIGAAMAWGAEVAEIASATTGAQVNYYREMYGPFGSVAWMTVQPDGAAVDAAQEALGSNPDYLAKIDEGTPLFLPGAANQGIATRIA